MKFKHLVAGLAFLFVAACGGGSGGASKAKVSLDTPDGTIMANVDALKRNDLAGFLSNNFTPEEIDEMESSWNEQRKKEPSAQEKAEFEGQMALLTADGAEDQIMGMIEPKLEEMKTQLPFMLMMAQTMGGQAIASNEDISDEEKETAQKMLVAVTEWAGNTDLASPELARKAVNVATTTARNLDIATLEDMQSLDFEEALSKGGMALAGTKEVLSVYGISMDEMLDSMEAKTVSTEGDSATVDVSFKFLGVDHSMPMKMLKDNGRWISSDAKRAVDEFKD